MPKAVQMFKTGKPNVLKLVDVEVGDPGPGEARITQKAIGVNFVDCYFRSGLGSAWFSASSFPVGLGLEGAGVVDAVGWGVRNVKVGDRVVYALGPLRSYAEQRNLPAEILIHIPKDLSFEKAAAIYLKGMTAQYLLRRTYPVKKGETILWHAAAGGMGLIACQWAKHLGAKVIGTVSSPAKAKIAKRHGCTYPINYKREDFVQRVKEITKGEGVPVVYDGVGKNTFMQSIDCLKRRGLMVQFGQASGAVEPFNTGVLGVKGSLFLTRAGLLDYTYTREELEATARDVFKVVRSGVVKVNINQRFKLKDAAKAHRALEGRKTTGSTILVP